MEGSCHQKTRKIASFVPDPMMESKIINLQCPIMRKSESRPPESPLGMVPVERIRERQKRLVLYNPQPKRLVIKKEKKEKRS